MVFPCGNACGLTLSTLVVGMPKNLDTIELKGSTLQSSIGFNLKRVYVAAYEDLKRRIADDRLTPQMLSVLTLIEENPGASQSALARALGIERSGMVVIIDHLSKRELVIRRVSEKDRRKSIIDLTCSGQDVLHRARQQAAQHEDEFFALLNDHERTSLIALLQKLQ